MFEYVYLGFVLVCALIAFADWKRGVLLSIFVDVLRDPVRKLSDGEPVWVTHCGLLLWAAIIYACWTQEARVGTRFYQLFPALRSVWTLVLSALIPAAGLSVLLYSNGVILAAMGGLSYLGPLFGLIVGVAFAGEPESVRKYMLVYSLTNSVMFVGNIAEYVGWNVPALGGLNGFNWVRQQTDVWVEMIGGWYRSPDVAGFHAGLVMVFAFALAQPSDGRGKLKPGWVAIASLAGFVMFLAGRRKMFLIPVTFLAIWGLLAFARSRATSSQVLFVFFLAVIAVFAIGFFLIQGDEGLQDHVIYASTAVEEFIPKLRDQAVLGSLTTVRQSGILGSGLGVATQGAHHLGGAKANAWQEDGTSRLFKELGVIGTILVFFAGYRFIHALYQAFKFPIADRQRLLFRDVALGIVAANLACFIISHQHYSGDPTSAIIPLIFLGLVFGQVVFAGNAQNRYVTTARVPMAFPSRVPQRGELGSRF